MVLGCRRRGLSGKGKVEITDLSSLAHHFFKEANNSLSKLGCVLRGVICSSLHIIMDVTHIAIHDVKGIVDSPD